MSEDQDRERLSLNPAEPFEHHHRHDGELPLRGFVFTELDQLAPEGAGHDDELEFIVSGPATGWTDGDSAILDKALDLAGITDAAERLTAAMAVDLLGVVILKPLVAMIEDGQVQLRDYFDKIKGGLGK